MSGHNPARRLFNFAVTIALASGTIAAAPVATATPQEAPTNAEIAAKPSWEDFRDSTFQDADGQYIVNGDIPISSEEELRGFYESLPSNEEDGIPFGELIANSDGSGKPALWNRNQVGNLTYCVSDRFGAQKDAVVAAMESGASLWERASSAIDFRYVASADGNCNTSNSSVVFSVEPVQTNQYLARAFFPGAPKSQRNVLVTPQATRSGWSASNILAHELGHVLGFRHEHTRPEAGTCFEDNNWVPLTSYDSRSIMHYPQCNGSSNDLGFSATDRAGVREAYGA